MFLYLTLSFWIKRQDGELTLVFSLGEGDLFQVKNKWSLLLIYFFLSRLLYLTDNQMNGVGRKMMRGWAIKNYLLSFIFMFLLLHFLKIKRNSSSSALHFGLMWCDINVISHFVIERENKNWLMLSNMSSQVKK